MKSQHNYIHLLKPSDFSPLARPLVDLIGVENTIKLSMEMSLSVLRIPEYSLFHQYRKGYERITRLIGAGNASRLFRHFSGQTITIPSCLQTLKTARNRYIVQQRSQGKAIDDLRHELCMSKRSILYVLKNFRDNDNE